MDYRELKIALEVLTEGREARIPRQLRLAAGQMFKQNEAWLTDEHIQGFGIAPKRVNRCSGGDLALKVYVDRKLPASELRHPVPNKVPLPGILQQPVLVDVEAIGTMHLDFAPIRSRTRPAIPGSSAAHTGVLAGTMGCLVRKAGDEDDLYVLSSCHTMALSGLANVGDSVIQPSCTDGGTAPGDTIAELAEWVQPVFSSTGFPNLVDAAIARVPRAGLVSSHVHLIGHPVGVSRVLRGSMVQKTGRTTSCTVGMVLDLDYRFQIDWPQPGRGLGRVGFREQVLCTKYASEGDSGAAVLNKQTRIVGLHVGGTEFTSVFCRIQHALNALNCALVPDPV